MHESKGPHLPLIDEFHVCVKKMSKNIYLNKYTSVNEEILDFITT